LIRSNCSTGSRAANMFAKAYWRRTPGNRFTISCIVFCQTLLWFIYSNTLAFSRLHTWNIYHFLRLNSDDGFQLKPPEVVAFKYQIHSFFQGCYRPQLASSTDKSSSFRVRFVNLEYAKLGTILKPAKMTSPVRELGTPGLNDSVKLIF
jgi:hypothetical protein